MSRHHPFSELTKDRSPERQAQVEEKVCALKQEMAQHELRQARAHSQADLAKRLDVNPPAVAKMERRTDMEVSNLRRLIEGMGGQLEIVAHVPEGRVSITHLSEVGTNATEPDVPATDASSRP
jgi:ribosome-binding protein aMBF1 (putative translation factor)